MVRIAILTFVLICMISGAFGESHNLVMTLCSGYPYHVYERFSGTLFDTGFQGRLVMFITQRDVATVQPLKVKYGDNIVFQVITWSFHPQSYRYFLYRDYLRTVTDVDKVFICDSRDLVFQKDIFTYPFSSEARLYLFAEDGTLTDLCNRNWLLNIDSVAYPSFQHQPILCSGSTLGTLTAMRVYLDTMTETITTMFINKGRTRELGSIDQGFHNYIAYHGILSTRLDAVGLKYAILNNKDNLVNTVGLSSVRRVNENGQIINPDDQVSYCAHQYDRFDRSLIQKMNDRSKYNFF